jgi:hypothetical protein
LRGWQKNSEICGYDIFMLEKGLVQIYTEVGKISLSYLCSGLKKYFSHIEPYVKNIAEQIKAANKTII